MLGIGRREFISLLGGVAAWPFPGQAQQPTMPMVGYLDFYAAEPTGIFLTAFRNGLSEAWLHRRSQRGHRIPLCEH